MGTPEVVGIDVHDEEALTAWYDVASAAARHDRPFALQESYAALAASVRDPSPWRQRILLAALVGGAVVGVAELRLSLTENQHLAHLEIAVHPDHRRRGIGTAVHDTADRLRRSEGRTTVVGEAPVPIGGTTAGHDFATAMGFASVHTEEHLVMRLPADPITADLLTRAVAGYEIVTWRERCPEEYRAAYLAMRNQMNLDVPVGEVDIVAVVIDEERLAASESRMAQSYVTVVAAARRLADGELGGYSVVLLDRADDVAIQDDTLVMPEHRGRGLGMQLKQATRAIVEAEHPNRTTLHTWTDPANAAMYRTNMAFGFAPVEVMHEMQRLDAPA